MPLPLLRTGIAGRLAHMWENLRGSLWFVPGLMALGAIVLALGVLEIDERWAPAWLMQSDWIYSRSAGGARDLLSTVAASMITIAGLTFSILVVALQLASSQFGPRVLRNYMRDRGSQFVLGTFIATFLYCLMVMRTIGDTDTDEPRLAVSLAVILAVASLAVLIYFLHHSAASIHAPNVITAVARELDAAIDRLYPTRMGTPGEDVPAPAIPPESEWPVEAPVDGYVQRIDGEALVRLASETEVVVRIVRRPGDFAVAGQALAFVSPRAAAAHRVRAGVEGAFILGSQRTPEQDVEFCFEQLVQVALRALSPAYNDPLTAAACVERLGAAFHRLLRRREPPAVRVSSEGRVRVVANPVSTARLIDLTLTPLIESAQGSSIVLRQLGSTVAGMAVIPCNQAVRRTIAEAVGMLQTATEEMPSPAARAEVRDRCAEALLQLRRGAGGDVTGAQDAAGSLH